MSIIDDLMRAEGITEYATINFEKLKQINPRLLHGASVQTALIMLIPYRHTEQRLLDGCNVGLFARCGDYHLYASMLFDRLLPKLKSEYGGDIYGFADHSPIAEKDAAQKCGLGFIGKNGLLINRRYGSFVFIAELLFTTKLEESTRELSVGCGGCNACVNACPTDALGDGGFERERCLSAISQKKKKTPDERALLHRTKTVWGCDICQNACPYNKKAEYGNIDFFTESFLSDFSKESVISMSDEEYGKYAFSYRSKAVMEENFLTVSEGYDRINT